MQTECQRRLDQLSTLLLEQHKRLLDREKEAWERVNGPVGTPGRFLGLVLNDPHFAWLRQISTLVVEIDEALARRSKADQPMAEALLAQTRDLMKPREQGSDFQQRYYAAIQESPDIVILQCKMESLLGV